MPSTSHRLPAPPLPPWLDAELPFERYMIDVGGRCMHVMEAGRGRPVVMLHGNPSWGYLYRHVAKTLDLTRFRVIMPDLIGFGLSDKPRDAKVHTLENHIGWFGSLLERLDIRDAIFVGQDWGGPIGFAALHDNPGRAAGLVVLNTAISPPRRGSKPTAFHRFSALPVVSDIAFRLLQLPQTLMTLAQGDKKSIRGQTAKAYRWALRDLRTNVGVLALARMVPRSQRHPSIPAMQRSHDLISGFKGPAAIVWGDRDPVLGSVRRWVQKQLPHASVRRTQAGHFLQEEVPDVIAEAIVEVASQL
jgi:pimeloyl-ACP methyl ester carboxylesterase